MGSHTYHQLTIHAVFSTKARTPLITTDIEKRLYGYFHGIAKDEGFTVIIANGTEDHVHLLLGIPPALSVSAAMKKLKAVSSRRISRANSLLHDFKWQEGFGAFSVSASQVQRLVRYIRRQKEHHEKETFSQEYKGLLRAHGIAFGDHLFE